jgi:FMN-dependent NADH-azoreductase
MTQILVVESSPRGANSTSRKLTAAIVEKLLSKHSGAQMVQRDLAAQPLPHLSPAHLNAFMAKAPEYTEDDKRAVQVSEAVSSELIAADVVVIGAPMWNFSVPSVLKSWIDHVARAGKTFRYTEKGAEGLLQGKKVYIAIASGNIYSSGPAKSLDFVEPYLRAVLGFMGLKDVDVVRAEGMGIPGVKDTALAKAVASIRVD